MHYSNVWEVWLREDNGFFWLHASPPHQMTCRLLLFTYSMLKVLIHMCESVVAMSFFFLVKKKKKFIIDQNGPLKKHMIQLRNGVDNNGPLEATFGWETSPCAELPRLRLQMKFCGRLPALMEHWHTKHKTKTSNVFWLVKSTSQQDSSIYLHCSYHTLVHMVHEKGPRGPFVGF